MSDFPWWWKNKSPGDNGHRYTYPRPDFSKPVPGQHADSYSTFVNKTVEIALIPDRSYIFAAGDQVELKTGVATIQNSGYYIFCKYNFENYELRLCGDPWLFDWTLYKHGKWRRVGDRIQCWARQKTIPSQFIAQEDAHVVDCSVEGHFGIDLRYCISVKVVGWGSNVTK